MEEKIVLGIDLGTSKIRVIIGKCKKKSIEILAYASVISEGIRNDGTIVNLTQMTNAIDTAIQSCKNEVIEHRREEDVVDEVYVGISGEYIGYQESSGETYITDKKTIQSSDIDKAHRIAIRKTGISEDNEVIHMVAKNYSVDNQEGIINPINMTGENLKANVYIVYASNRELTNLRTSISNCESLNFTKKIKFVLQPFVAGLSVMIDGERRGNVLLIDIGNDKTDVALFCHDSISFFQMFKMGGLNATLDLMHGVGISRDVAEKIKIEKCDIAVNNIDDAENVELTHQGKIDKCFSRKLLSKIVACRYIEIFEEIKEVIHSNSLDYTDGVIITGGGSMVKNLDTLALKIFNCSIRQGIPNPNNIQRSNKTITAADSTVTGLLKFASKEIFETSFYSEKQVSQKFSGKIVKFFKEFF